MMVFYQVFRSLLVWVWWNPWTPQCKTLVLKGLGSMNENSPVCNTPDPQPLLNTLWQGTIAICRYLYNILSLNSVYQVRLSISWQYCTVKLHCGTHGRLWLWNIKIMELMLFDCFLSGFQILIRMSLMESMNPTVQKRCCVDVLL